MCVFCFVGIDGTRTPEWLTCTTAEYKPNKLALLMLLPSFALLDFQIVVTLDSYHRFLDILVDLPIDFNIHFQVIYYRFFPQ